MNFIKYKILFLTMIILIVNYPSLSQAYIDPGNLNIIIQFIFGILAAILAFVSFYYNKIKIYISKIIRNFKKNNDKK